LETRLEKRRRHLLLNSTNLFLFMFLLLLKVVVLNVEMLKIVVNCYRVETGENKTEENKKSVVAEQQVSWPCAIILLLLLLIL
jgi:Golgi 4-transmembrane spanning transporter.